ncbi:MAG: hypothetical protein IPI04_19490 [Ignavibacteria bacterium]|nr:hypothetical protein [Ignavibacteria bacterium]
MYPEFSFYEKDNTGSDVYKYSSSNSKGSGKYFIEVLFNQDIIKEMRLTGQRSGDFNEFNEFDYIRFSIQDEFFTIGERRLMRNTLPFLKKMN